jgi:N-acetylglutamate synthase/N-acetylornithine aminotransferase
MSVNAPQGFVAVGGYAGIKAAKAHDVAVVATADGRAVPAAGVFTSNLAAAAPVQVSRDSSSVRPVSSGSRSPLTTSSPKSSRS